MAKCRVAVLVFTVLASEVPLAGKMPAHGEMELSFSGSFDHMPGLERWNVRTEAAWFVTDRQQFGGNVAYSRAKDEVGYRSESRELGLLYRYNVIDQTANFFPYFGSRLRYQEVDESWTVYEDVNEYSVQLHDAQTIGDLHAGIKFMLNEHVAWDNGVVFQRVLEGSYRETDWWSLQSGLSIFF